MSRVFPDGGALIDFSVPFALLARRDTNFRHYVHQLSKRFACPSQWRHFFSSAALPLSVPPCSLTHNGRGPMRRSWRRKMIMVNLGHQISNPESKARKLAQDPLIQACRPNEGCPSPASSQGERGKRRIIWSDELVACRITCCVARRLTNVFRKFAEVLEPLILQSITDVLGAIEIEVTVVVARYHIAFTGFSYIAEPNFSCAISGTLARRRASKPFATP